MKNTGLNWQLNNLLLAGLHSVTTVFNMTDAKPFQTKINILI